MVSSKFGSSQKSRSKSTSRGPTELMTIGGTAGSRLPTRTKSPFERLDDEAKGKYGNETKVQTTRSQVHTASTEYASSGDSDTIDTARQHARTTSNREMV